MAVTGLPGEVVLVEGTVGLPQGKDEVEQLAHAMADGDVAAFALGLEAGVESAEGRIVADAHARGIPQVVPDQIVAFARHAQGKKGGHSCLLCSLALSRTTARPQA